MVAVVCTECKNLFNKSPSQMRSKKGNNFCSLSCSVSFNNKNKESGDRRSRIELWLEGRIKGIYPALEVHYNKKDAIGSELDIYIPSLKLAFELSGPTHYEIVYTEEVLINTRKNDELKRAACLEKGIELVEINVSKLKEFRRNPELEIIVYKVLDKISAKLKIASGAPLSGS